MRVLMYLYIQRRNSENFNFAIEKSALASQLILWAVFLIVYLNKFLINLI